jgi:putative membrane protein
VGPVRAAAARVCRQRGPAGHPVGMETSKPVEGAARDHLANERTQLAWLRTAATVMVLGLAIARFGDEGGSSGRSVLAGGVLVAAGGVGVVYGTMRYRSTARALRRGDLDAAQSTIGPIVSAAVLLVAVVLSIVVLGL